MNLQNFFISNLKTATGIIGSPPYWNGSSGQSDKSSHQDSQKEDLGAQGRGSRLYGCGQKIFQRTLQFPPAIQGWKRSLSILLWIPELVRGATSVPANAEIFQRNQEVGEFGQKTFPKKNITLSESKRPEVSGWLNTEAQILVSSCSQSMTVL